MKWGEFKKAVEAAGVTDKMTVSFVDVYCPEAATELRVEIEPIEEIPDAQLPGRTASAAADADAAQREFAVTN
jgi:hypothetical protein